MLPKGILSRILDYFFSNQEELYKGEAERALMEFFDVKDEKKLQSILNRPMNNTQSGILDEWVLFDFKLRNGKKLIEEYKNNTFTTDYELKIYNDLLDTNFYSFFQVINVALDEGLVLRDLKTNNEYDVKEKSATHEVKNGNLIFARLGKFDGHWEMVGANAPMIPAVKIDKNFRDIYLKDNNPITPQMAFEWAKTEGENKIEEILDVDPDEAKMNFEKVLKDLELNKFVSVDLVEKWCKNIDDKNCNEAISLLSGFLNDDKNGRQLDKLIRAFSDFANTIPRKILGGKSPLEKQKEIKNWKPQLNISITPLGGEKWRAELDKAHGFMAERDAQKAIKHFEKTFLFLKKEFSANSDIYRFYANTATSYFGNGERFLGKAVLAMALNLNPNYDFGQKVERDYKAGAYENQISNGLFYNAAYRLKNKIKDKIKKKYKIEDTIINEILEKVKEISDKEEKDIKNIEKIKEK